MEYVFSDEKSVEVTSAGTYNTGRITTTTDHDFKVGDIVTYEASGSNTEQIIGLVVWKNLSGMQKFFGTKTFTQDFDGGAIDYGAGNAALGTGAGAKFLS